MAGTSDGCCCGEPVDASFCRVFTEEWITKKKTELTTTKQIETRVKRHVVLEDGKVVDDSGPIVTTNTTEDTEKQEHQHTEHRTHGDDPPSGDEGWVAVPGPGGTVREVKEKKVRSREEKEERRETEDIHHHGDITDEVRTPAAWERGHKMVTPQGTC
ncbi:uncharacterized protein LOC127749890 isoform X3 [Frankliniella occidentalis]|uniref:Uncharacterized protein LOC127749890 isoform X3 n=1 Tax=Frankliniella occidentalis TaxID=133901 RepID=A0A9C6UDR3_FRAOC|nr:uncharacterized protein LOC127749890 isoform X3 [Frankliniella occidentalis]